MIGNDSTDELMIEVKDLYEGIVNDHVDDEFMMNLERKKIEIKCSKFTKNIFEDIQIQIQDSYNDICLNKNINISDEINCNIKFNLDEGIKKKIERFRKIKRDDLHAKDDAVHGNSHGIQNKVSKKDKEEIVKNNVIFIDIYRHCKLIKCNQDCS